MLEKLIGYFTAEFERDRDLHFIIVKKQIDDFERAAGMTDRRKGFG